MELCNIHSSNVDFTKLPESLETLTLTHNFLRGDLTKQEIQWPPRLSSFAIGMNQFSGEIDLRKIPETLKFVDISNNNFGSYRMTKEDFENREKNGLRLNVDGNPFEGMKKKKTNK